MEPWSVQNPHSGGVEAQNVAVKGFCRPGVADFHHFDEEQYLDPDPHEKWDPNPVCLKFMRIRNLVIAQAVGHTAETQYVNTHHKIRPVLQLPSVDT
jgi:hypothetical protein